MDQISLAILAVSFQRWGTAMAMERLAHFSDEVTEGRNIV